MSNTIDQKEIQAFSKDAGKWWDREGPFAPLHRLNPVRMDYIRRLVCTHFGLDMNSIKPFKGLSAIDIGCGGGLAAEPMCRLGAATCGIDADAVAIDVARDHARGENLSIAYKTRNLEEVQDQFDIVLALEIIEHVTAPAAFIRHCKSVCKPGGIVIFSTLNRTPQSFALGVVAAEYILRWVPAGTHTWKKFVKPSELAAWGRAADLTPIETMGLRYSPMSKEFKLSKHNLDVNYFISFRNNQI